MSLTISAAQVASFIANPSSFTGYSSGSHVIISGAISHTQATDLNAVSATYIQATVSETTIANLAAISVNNSTRSSLNKYSFLPFVLVYIRLRSFPFYFFLSIL